MAGLISKLKARKLAAVQEATLADDTTEALDFASKSIAELLASKHEMAVLALANDDPVPTASPPAPEFSNVDSTREYLEKRTKSLLRWAAMHDVATLPGDFEVNETSIVKFVCGVALLNVTYESTIADDDADTAAARKSKVHARTVDSMADRLVNTKGLPMQVSAELKAWLQHMHGVAEGTTEAKFPPGLDKDAPAKLGSGNEDVAAATSRVPGPPMRAAAE